ncbi:MAG TPA: SusD/RagB family nutrient-binding outer membrane lipoprotein [Sediminibacterium sp.]|nr:SusD/RagB family nutrient-binding outer membrane lipoprotein [Sediminibacterium sp.]HQS54874.1 SusD/RagB family nutrient-binding outer membrane lipoprotein [Sediminibacterium sp.]
MKNISFITTKSAVTIFAIGVIAFASCSKKLDEAYLNPNNPVEGAIEAILPNVTNQMTSTAAPPAGGGGGSYGPAAEAVNMGRYIQFWNAVGTNDNYDQMGGVFGTASDNTGLVWAMHYYGIGANAKFIISRGIQQEKWDYVGVAHAIFAYSWLTLTEEYGEVILRQAFDGSRSTFEYNTQSDVYDSVRIMCDNAITYLNRTDGKVSPANLKLGDAFFLGGDVAKWKKFVYAIKARTFAHLSNKAIYGSRGYADSVIKYTDLSVSTNAENATQRWSGGNFSGTNNYYGPFRGNIGSIRQSAFIANLLSGTSTESPFAGVFDPRTPYLINENTNKTYKGVVPNLGTSGLAIADRPLTFWRQVFTSTTSAVPDSGRYIFNNLAPFPVLTAAEVQFMKAEAAFRKGDKALALAAYTKGINMSFDLLVSEYQARIPGNLRITDATRNAYFANTKVIPATPAGLTMTMIMLQKYIALYGYGFNETWTDLRRFHYTDLDPATGKQVYAGFQLPSTLTIFNNGKPVYRARPRYNSEYLYNIPNLQLIGALASDYHTKEHWFSQP